MSERVSWRSGQWGVGHWQRARMGEGSEGRGSRRGRGSSGVGWERWDGEGGGVDLVHATAMVGTGEEISEFGGGLEAEGVEGGVVSGRWMKSEVRSPKSEEVRSPKSEVRSPKSEVRSRKPRAERIKQKHAKKTKSCEKAQRTHTSAFLSPDTRYEQMLCPATVFVCYGPGLNLW